MPITYWLEYLDVILLYKILNNQVIIAENIRPKEFLSRATRHSSVKENIKLRVPFAKTVTFQTSFFLYDRVKYGTCKIVNLRIEILTCILLRKNLRRMICVLYSMFLAVKTLEHGILFTSYANKLGPQMFSHPSLKIPI